MRCFICAMKPGPMILFRDESNLFLHIAIRHLPHDNAKDRRKCFCGDWVSRLEEHFKDIHPGHTPESLYHSLMIGVEP